MRTYKFYYIGKTGHVESPPAVLEAASDHDAIVEANRAAKDRDVEVWLEQRLVAYVTPSVAA